MFRPIFVSPPRTIKKFIYNCGNSFVLEPIEELHVESKEKYGLMELCGENCSRSRIRFQSRQYHHLKRKRDFPRYLETIRERRLFALSSFSRPSQNGKDVFQCKREHHSVY